MSSANSIQSAPQTSNQWSSWKPVVIQAEELGRHATVPTAERQKFVSKDFGTDLPPEPEFNPAS